MKACFLTSFVLFLCVTGCITSENENAKYMNAETYTVNHKICSIDSNPRGLRVLIDNVECGVTPYEFTSYTDGRDENATIRIIPPTAQQIQEYEFDMGFHVLDWYKDEKTAVICSDDRRDVIFFQFVLKEAKREAPYVEPTIDDKDIYVIDSVPQGLRVTVNDFERGVTPCKLDRTDYREVLSLDICVEAPSKQQIERYKEQNKKIVSLWWAGDKRKTIRTREPGGTLRFNFIDAEYDEPKTEEEWEWVRNAIEEDVKELEERSRH